MVKNIKAEKQSLNPAQLNYVTDIGIVKKIKHSINVGKGLLYQAIIYMQKIYYQLLNELAVGIFNRELHISSVNPPKITPLDIIKHTGLSFPKRGELKKEQKNNDINPEKIAEARKLISRGFLTDLGIMQRTGLSIQKFGELKKEQDNSNNDERKIKLAKKYIQKGDLTTLGIQNYTGLSVSKIEDLKKEQKNNNPDKKIQ